MLRGHYFRSQKKHTSIGTYFWLINPPDFSFLTVPERVKAPSLLAGREQIVFLHGCTYRRGFAMLYWVVSLLSKNVASIKKRYSHNFWSVGRSGVSEGNASIRSESCFPLAYTYVLCINNNDPIQGYFKPEEREREIGREERERWDKKKE